MRRKDREVINNEEIHDILSRCDTIRIGMHGNEYPYIIPVSFGMEIIEDKPVIYFHCTKHGLKTDLLKVNPYVCIEGDIFMKVEKTANGITTRYESIIGFGKSEFVEDPDEIIRGLKLLTQHYGYKEYPLERCRGLAHVKMCKIRVDTLTGERNLPVGDLQF